MVNIGKTDITKKLENSLRIYTRKDGHVFGCEEVTIGIGGKERVDYITIDTKQIVRCYEIKVSKADFYSKAANTFIGNFNYYVLTSDLYEIVKHDIPKHIGVIIGGHYVQKKPKKQEFTYNIESLLMSMVRSLHRQAMKVYDSENAYKMQTLKTRVSQLERENEKYYKYYRNYEDLVFNELGEYREYELMKQAKLLTKENKKVRRNRQ